MFRASLPWLLLLAVLASGCTPKAVKPPPAPADPAGAAAPRDSGTAIRRARPDLPGEYTAGGLYKPGVADSGPAVPPDISALKEPVPHEEPRARYGNRSPYTVLGRSYHVMDSARGYSERGTASWYGEKFHGRATSSLEPYDMYAFSAAHKTLPLPTYVRVTNRENGRSVVVRVNDRGPFHAGRIIDLSYAAAIKLGMHVKGTASVEVHALTPGEAEPALASQPPMRRDHAPRVPSAGARRVAQAASGSASARSADAPVKPTGMALRKAPRRRGCRSAASATRTMPSASPIGWKAPIWMTSTSSAPGSVAARSGACASDRWRDARPPTGSRRGCARSGWGSRPWSRSRTSRLARSRPGTEPV
jgi:rare lipoprotein A